MEDKTLASVVKSAREKVGISQRELSRRTGIDNNTLAKIEKGERKKPNVLSLRKISYILNIKLEELLKLSGYNEQDIEVALNQNHNNITILNTNSTIIMLEDIINDSKNELVAKEILNEIMSKIDYENIDYLKNLSSKNKKIAIKNFKNLIKNNEKDIKNLKESIEKGLEILNRKTNWKEKNYFFQTVMTVWQEINTLWLSLLQMSLLSSSRK